MAGYLPQIQHASECEWAYRREVVFPARAREAALLRAARPDRAQGRLSALGRWFLWFGSTGERSSAGPVGQAPALPLDGAA